MNKLTIGILAHVDSGKTTLSEALLYKNGAIRTMGRVDHKNTFLDTDELEKKRGITIFSKQAHFKTEHFDITLLDTPGHVDFSAETERTLCVLDVAILVISGSSGVQSHTETLWRLLRKHNIPTVLFINKMDLPNADKETLMRGITKRLSSSCFAYDNNINFEELAMCDEALMEDYLENMEISDVHINQAFNECKIFPCLFGSALKNEGITELCNLIDNMVTPCVYNNEFGAKVFKISHDENGARLTFLKVTGGSIAVKSIVEYVGVDEKEHIEKIEQIRIYHGEKYVTADIAESGDVCALTGLSSLIPGNGLGFELESDKNELCPVLNYRIFLPKSIDCHTAMQKFKILEQEDPVMTFSFDEHSKEINVLLMGEIQLEVLKHKVLDRFGFEITFGNGTILYKETIDNTVEGVGHFEPLKHYAEVHLLLEKGQQGTGLVFSTDCDTDELDRNWQRLILTQLEEKTHYGILTGSPITDIKITLVSGKAHKKHTEGGDFREATYRAVRNGLMKAKSVLLEPWYNFEITVPTDNVGRVLSDIQKMCGTVNAPDTGVETSIITGTCPVSEMASYPATLASVSKGKGSINLSLKGYDVCHNSEEIIDSKNYDPLSDIFNSPDSVFCASGSGFIVKWDEVESYMHLPSCFTVDKEVIEQKKELKRRAEEYCSSVATDKELMEIFERTYGPIKKKENNRKVKYNPSVQKPVKYKQTPKPVPEGPEYLLIDGYNILYAWDEYKGLASHSLEQARNALIERICNYQGFCKQQVILVFDAYKVKKNPGTVESFRNITVVYTKEAETADSYIEKASYKLSKNHIVRVATSDGPEQLIILGNGALRVPALSFCKEVTDAEKAIRNYLDSM